MIKRIAQAWGFAAILLLPSYVDLTSSLGDERMHVPWPLTRMALAQLADLAIEAIAFAGLMAILRKLKAWTMIRWILLAFLPVCLLVRNLSLFPFHVPSVAVSAVSAVWIAVLAFFILRVPKIASRLYGLGSAVLTGFAVFAVVISWQLVHAALWRPAPQAFARPIPMPPQNRPRLIWIVFDELAYKPAFETRDPSLKLPNFDRLRSESTLYTDVTPIAYNTTRVVPSLQLGRAVTKAVYTSDNRFLVRTEDSPHWQPFDVNASLFGMAKQRGMATSIVGWYIAYCPIFAGAANECYWSNDDTEDGAPPSHDASFAEDVLVPATDPGRTVPRAAHGMDRHWGLGIPGSHCNREGPKPARARNAGHEPGRSHLSASSRAASAGFLGSPHTYVCCGRIVSRFVGLFRPATRADARHPPGAAALGVHNRDRAGRSLLAHAHMAASGRLDRRG